MANYRRFLQLLSKWPSIETRKRMDYGAFLRGLLKDKDPLTEIFPGNSVENAEKLDSLYRLLSNKYSNKYPCNKKMGAAGIPLEEVEYMLNHNVVEDEKTIRHLRKSKNG